MSLAPILFHYFPVPLPYAAGLHLQEAIHAWQLSKRREAQIPPSDVILLLQHRPVYTAGRRQTDEELEPEMRRLMKMGADFVKTKRGGQTTYHGPGQLVVYPLLDLARQKMSLRDYVCFLQTSIKRRLSDAHGIESIPSDNTGVFLDDTTKIASIGIQARHRLTMHGLALNVTKEPKAWFDQVVACGLADVKAGSIADYNNKGSSNVSVEEEAKGLLDIMAAGLGRQLEPIYSMETAHHQDPQLGSLIRHAHEEAVTAGPWLNAPGSNL